MSESTSHLIVDGKRFALDYYERPVILFDEIEVVTSTRDRAYVAGQYSWQPLSIKGSKELIDTLLINGGSDIIIEFENKQWEISGCWVLADSDLEDNEINLSYHHAKLNLLGENNG